MAEARFVEMPIQNQMPIYTGRSGQPVIDVQTDGETVWLTQAQLVRLFDSSKANISEHIKNIFTEGELDAEAVVRKFRTTASDGKTYMIQHYNLDMVISLGYRVHSQVATHFRQWATARLREYIVKGFAMDDERLKGRGGGHYWKELKIMNNLVSAYFDLAEVKAMNKEPMHMSDWIQQLDRLVQTFDKSILTDAGSVNKKDADQKAETEYKKYQAATLSPVESAYLESVKALEKKVKSDKKETE